MTEMGLRRTLRRFQKYAERASREAARLGHKLGTFGFEEEHQAAVTNCRSCGEIAAVDLTESPYLFGRALTQQCK